MQEVTPEYMASDAYIEDVRAGRRELPPVVFNVPPIRHLSRSAAERVNDYFVYPRVGTMDRFAKVEVKRDKSKRKAQKLARRKNRK